MSEVSLEDQLRCVCREIKMREGVYPKRVASGRMTQKKSDEELNAMRAVRDTIMELIREKNGTPLL